MGGVRYKIVDGVKTKQSRIEEPKKKPKKKPAAKKKAPAKKKPVTKKVN